MNPDTAMFSLDVHPGVLPDFLIQMTLNKVFIPLSMLTIDSLNRIKMNQDVNYKHISYGSGLGKIFLNETCFPSEDDLDTSNLTRPI